MVPCSQCGCLNEEEVVFCRECHGQVKRHSRQEIARLQQTSLCPDCNYYNPIEETTCVKCGTQLRNVDFVVKDASGRESVIRDVNSGAFVNGFLWVSFVSVLLLLLLTGVSSMFSSGGLSSFLKLPAGKVFFLVIIVMASILAIEWKSGLLYRTKIVTVCFLAFLALGTFIGKTFFMTIKLGLWDFNCLLLIGELLTLIFAMTFLVRTRFSGSFFASIMALVGLYCCISPIVFLFNYSGFLISIQKLPPVLRDFPIWLGPTFVAYHFFFPYALFQMIGSALKALLKSMEKVDGTKSIVRFLNRRKEEARGELLNIFVVGITLFTGFSIMVQVRVPNIVSLIYVSIKRL